MPKFNKKNTLANEIANHPDVTTNYEGGVAFKTSAKTELTLRIVTYLVNEPKFYGNKTDEMTKLQELISAVANSDPEYILKLASYARNEMYLRSAPIFLLVEAVQYDSVKPYVARYVPAIVRRADELTEVIAYFIAKNGQIGSGGKASLPNCLKKGLGVAFNNFDEYQFAKYDRDGAVKLKDVIKLVHPKPKSAEQSALFKRIKDRTLKTPETWETAISGKGSTKEAWEAILPNMGYMAKIRNLRNLLKVGADITKVVEHLTNPKAVANSKQFPFRFLSAYKVLEKESAGSEFDRRQLMSAVATALELSVVNIPKFKGKTFVTCDNSGSMESAISAKSTVQRIEVGNVLGAMAYKLSGNGMASVFGQSFAVPRLNPNDSVMTNAQKLIRTNVGHSTNAYLALKYLVDNKIVVDRILIFSDEQCYDDGTGRYYGYGSSNSLYAELKKYKRTVNPNVILYSIDVAGYGTTQFPENESNVVLIGGWSDKVLTFIQMYEEFGTDMLKTINEYTV